MGVQSVNSVWIICLLSAASLCHGLHSGPKSVSCNCREEVLELREELRQLKSAVAVIKADVGENGGLPREYIRKCYSGDIGSGENVHEAEPYKYHDVTVHFPQPFWRAPAVSVGLRQFDLGQWSFAFSWINPYHKINVHLLWATADAMAVRFQAKDDSEILYATASYIACA